MPGAFTDLRMKDEVLVLSFLNRHCDIYRDRSRSRVYQVSACRRLRCFQNARIRGPASSMLTRQANFSRHMLRSPEGASRRGEPRGQLCLPACLTVLLCCCASCPALSLHGHRQWLEQRDAWFTFSQRRKISSPPSPSSWSDCTTLAHHLP